jgi:eukaryotic-like serine/threonine-protein kinase
MRNLTDIDRTKTFNPPQEMISASGLDRFRTGGALKGRVSEAWLDDQAPSFPPGTQMGVWQLQSLIGRGGMSEVYQATRTGASFQQTVALKIVNSGAGLSERLSQERRVLARLKHPGIAGLIDGGELDDGRAWFAMEFVEGQCLDDYVFAQQSTWSQRIELFEALCSAVMHAHTHLLVHRDIKPSNVIVDAQGRLRLLDFGIAIASYDSSIAKDRFMTPGFAAPEQLQGAEITTATDIYQLGESLRRITLAGRDYQPNNWPKPVLLGLQAIIARATATEPTQRYDSVARMQEDLAALRAFEPVRAVGGGIGYRTGLLIRKHPRAAVLVAAMCLFALGSAISLVRSIARENEERRIALREEHTATAIGNFFVELFHEPRSGECGVAGLLDRGQKRLLANRRETPETRAALLRALALANMRMERSDTARPLLVEAIAAQRALGQSGFDELSLSLATLSRVDFAKGDGASARQLADEAQSVLDRSQNSSSHTRFLTLEELGGLHIDALEFKTADALLARALALGAQRYGAESVQLYHVKRLQVESKRNQWQVETALPLNQALLTECVRNFGADDPSCIVETTNVARLQSFSGQLVPAEETFRKQLAQSAEWTGKLRLYRTHAAMFDLSENLWLQGRLPEARRTMELSLEKLLEVEGGAGLHWDSDRGALALLLVDMGLAEQAFQINSTRKRRELAAPAVMEDHFWIVRQASVELALERIDPRTAPALAQAVQAMLATYGERSYFANNARLVSAQIAMAAGDDALAEQLLKAVENTEPQGLQLHYPRLMAELALQRAKLAAKRNDPAGARALQQSALAHLPDALFSANHPVRASLTAQILLTRPAPWSEAERAQMIASVAALGSVQDPTAPLLLAAQKRLSKEAQD